MKLLDKLLLCLFSGLISSLAPTGVLAAPAVIPSVILDTDIGSDCDDAGALAVLHALADAGELEILGVIFSSGKNRYGVGTCDAINTYYGRGDLPLGQYQGNDVGDPGNSYTSQIAENSSRFGHNLVDQAPGLVETYKTILSPQADRSVTICTIGHPHGLVHLLRDPEGEKLVRAKVSRWVAMGMGGWNFVQMGMSSYTEELLREWPVPFYISPAGKDILTGHRLLPATGKNNPVREAYRLWGTGTALTEGRSSWDQVAVLFTARPELFEVSDFGKVGLQDDGNISWNRTENHPNHFLVEPGIPGEKMAEIIEILMARPPKHNDSFVPPVYSVKSSRYEEARPPGEEFGLNSY